MNEITQQEKFKKNFSDMTYILYDINNDLNIKFIYFLIEYIDDKELIEDFISKKEKYSENISNKIFFDLRILYTFFPVLLNEDIKIDNEDIIWDFLISLINISEKYI